MNEQSILVFFKNRELSEIWITVTTVTQTGSLSIFEGRERGLWYRRGRGQLISLLGQVCLVGF